MSDLLNLQQIQATKDMFRDSYFATPANGRNKAGSILKTPQSTEKKLAKLTNGRLKRKMRLLNNKATKMSMMSQNMLKSELHNYDEMMSQTVN